MSRVTWNIEGFKAQLNTAVVAGLDAAGITLQRDMTLIIGRNHGGVASAPGQPPNSQTNRLRSSIRTTRGNDLSVSVGTNVAYGRHLEYGVTIRARGKLLAIPMSKEARAMTAQGIKPRSIINAFSFDKSRPLRWIKTKSGGVLIVREHRGTSRAGKGKRSEPLFLLSAKSVIKPRPWMRPALERSKVKMLGEFVRFARAASRGGITGRLA